MRAGWAWFAGGDGFVLRQVPSEASFLNGLGMWVAGMAVVSGFGMTVAASQWWSTSIVSVLWVLPLWAVLYSLIERLVLKSFGTNWKWNLGLSIPRFALSLRSEERRVGKRCRSRFPRSFYADRKSPLRSRAD